MLDLSVLSLLDAYRAGALTPAQVIDEVLRRCDACPDPAIWIARLSREQLRPYLDGLIGHSPETKPLFGVPFAIKDNIDLAGLPTTAACPEYAYTPERSAFVVERLIAAGAIPIGKSNLDQFATGLVGTRSPYGEVRNSFDGDYISGGSSSGSAAAVARGLVSFSLGTDTAGSGRVPAAFCNLVGIKPTRGRLSTSGVVPACRSLDCVSLFALDLADAQAVMAVADGFDPADAFARPTPEQPAFPSEEGYRFGIPQPDQLEFFGDTDSARLFGEAVERLKSLGGEAVEIDFSPFAEAAWLLYQGPWVAERYAAIRPFITAHPEALLPVTRAIIEPARELRTVDAFAAQYRLAGLRRQAERVMANLDAILTPTAPTLYRRSEVAADPIALNSRLGTYTNFMNLLDLAAVALPAGFRPDGLPFGVTLFGPAWSDERLWRIGERFHLAQALPRGATGLPASPRMMATEPEKGRMAVVVCGAHMEGLALNHQLREKGGRLVKRTRTAPKYRFYALAGGPPKRPGLIRRPGEGAGIEVEVWSLPNSQVGVFLAQIPSPLGLGSVELEDGSWEKGFICEGFAAEGAEEITPLGGWRAYLEREG